MITRMPIWHKVVITPSDAPAAELPEVEPTAADLLAVEIGDDRVAEDRIAAALELAAYEHTHRELSAIRRALADTFLDELAEDTTPEWRTAA
ncbi:hypothetical protein DI005_20045 [Prauserella sp. PE36]|uniref:hypothetical protein n=1 Tax=Prauserella sp. PE36 TaxID=1504709 RepID=UPI000DE1AD22|nr:hypothetical protein [Prauserella sp. PE36]RBM18088.1 hypothetical protein DI005_20045 [Prauserella sp. PE36]